MKPTRPAPAAGFAGATTARARPRSSRTSWTRPCRRSRRPRPNLYNLYVYFWRWALWKVFESKTAAGPGVASYISASSYLDGDAFCGMAEHIAGCAMKFWILDLGGEGRGTAQERKRLRH